MFKRCSAHLLLQNAELIQHFDFWNATDGTEDRHQGKVSRCANLQAHRPDSLDTVTIDRRRPTVMFVDDTGMIDGKPVNPKRRRYIPRFAGQERCIRYMETRSSSRREGWREAGKQYHHCSENA